MIDALAFQPYCFSWVKKWIIVTIINSYNVSESGGKSMGKNFKAWRICHILWSRNVEITSYVKAFKDCCKIKSFFLVFVMVDLKQGITKCTMAKISRKNGKYRTRAILTPSWIDHPSWIEHPHKMLNRPPLLSNSCFYVIFG